ncbi:MAG: DUF1883 domain-containing protein [Spartobacteria bacterium]|nr:DUF1883 domain-containing protein [Spartobacteria bacterium]
MQFIYKDLGFRHKGEIVEVKLTNGANVRLMDTANFSNYKARRDHRYYGGLVRRSPLRLAIPRSGSWHVAVDTQGLRNGTRASIRMVPGPLPELKETPLSSVSGLVRDREPLMVEGDVRAYDVFISHASEDKEEVVRPLHEALIAEGLSVWYDEITLRIGDSLRRKIDSGIARSRVALVVLSPSFLSKGWTAYELDGIVSRSVAGEQQLLPIWHNLTKQEVMDFSPSLADKVARSTVSHTVEDIAREIAELLE